MNKVYFKNVDTGVVKTFEEWKQEAIEFFTNKYNHEQELKEEFKTLADYLKWADERGYFYNDLVECDEAGNPVEY